MNDELRFDELTRSWLDLGPVSAPDRALEAALLEIDQTTQERDLRVPWRLPTMFTSRMAAAVLAIVVIAGGAFALSRIPGPGQVGPTPTPVPTSTQSPTATPAPTPSPTPTPKIGAAGVGVTYPAGTYQVTDFAVPFTVTLDAGWVNQGYTPHSFTLRNDNTFLALVIVDSIYPDPCHLETPPNAVEPGVDTLLGAFSGMAGFTVTGAQPVTIGGATGKSFTLANTIDLVADQCSRNDVLWIGRDGDDAPVLETPNGADALWALDVSGTTVLIGGPPAVVHSIVFGAPAG